MNPFIIMGTFIKWAEKALKSRRDRLLALRAGQGWELESLGEQRRSDRDFLDQAAEDGGTAVTARLSEAEYRELSAIDAALKRIAGGTYGECESCGGPVGQQRLRALPEARLCTSCVAAGESRVA
jgi:RNA polymerase-binding transcription factor